MMHGGAPRPAGLAGWAPLLSPLKQIVLTVISEQVPERKKTHSDLLGDVCIAGHSSVSFQNGFLSHLNFVSIILSKRCKPPGLGLLFTWKC